MVSAARMSRRTKKPAVAGGAPGTFTLYPTAQSGSLSSEGTTYAISRGGVSPAFVGANPSGSISAGQHHTNGGAYTDAGFTTIEGFLDFDTSGVTGTITSATLSLGLQADVSTTDFVAQARVRDWGSTLEGSDFVPGADLAALTLVATLASLGIGATGVYKNMTENGTNLRGAINQAGFTRFVLASDRTAGSNAPATDSFETLDFHAYNHATLKPKLVVVTT